MKFLAGLSALALAIPAAVLSFVLFGGGCAPLMAPGDASSSTQPAAVGAWKGEQLTNAAIIVDTIAKRQLPTAAQVIAVAAAMGESSLINLQHDDDATNPDGSIADGGGLFQQQVSQGWGTWAEVTDPVHATNTFIDRLIKLPGWETLPVTTAIHRVQGNKDPLHYAKFESDARAVVAAVTGKAPADAGAQSCAAGSGDFPPATGAAPGPWGGNKNGRIPENTLAPIPWATKPRPALDASIPYGEKYRLRADAVAALIALNAEFRAQFGHDLTINDAYRDFAEQVRAKQKYGKKAATPGSSNHGWALAIDVANPSRRTIGFSDPIYLWLKANAPRFGWQHPQWAEPGGSGPDEAWHWEYYGLAA